MNPDLPTVPPEPPLVTPAGSRGQIAPPSPGLLGALGWCVSLILVMGGSMILFIAADVVVRYGVGEELLEVLRAEADQFQRTKEPGPDLKRAMGTGLLGASAASLLYTWLIVGLRVGPGWPRKLAVRLPRFDHFVLALLLLPALMILHGGAHHLAERLFPADQNAIDMNKMVVSIIEPWPRWLTVLVIGVAPGIGEELWCRGFLGRGLVGRYGWFGGVLLTSLFFGMLHVQPAYALGTAAMGACLHFSYLTTRSLLIPILLHMLNNSLTMFLMLGDILLGRANPDKIESPAIYLSSALLAFAVGVALYRSRGRLVDSAGEPVATPFPTLGLPPEDSGHRIVHASVPVWAWGLALLSAIGFGLAVGREF